jgi:Tfp pilus assembly protein PilF
MKQRLGLLVSIFVFICVAGCSTPNSRVARDHESMTSGKVVEDARLLYQCGQFDAAKQKLQSVLQTEPDNSKALYYLNLVNAAKYQTAECQQHPQPWGYYQTIPQQPIY